MQLSPNFSFAEACETQKAVDKNGDGFLSDIEKAEFKALNMAEAKLFVPAMQKVCFMGLEPVRFNFGKVFVTSFFRGQTLNGLVNGSPTSQHCIGEAVDYNVAGMGEREGQIKIMRWFIQTKIPFGQLLLERGCIHFGSGFKREVAEAVHDGTKWIKTPIPELAGCF